MSYYKYKQDMGTWEKCYSQEQKSAVKQGWPETEPNSGNFPGDMVIR